LIGKLMRKNSFVIVRLLLGLLALSAAYLLGKFNSCALSRGLFKGPVHIAAADGFETLSVREIISNRWFRLEQHTVRVRTGGVEKTVDDWFWFYEPDHVNVLVHEAASDQFLVFRQSKYGIEGETLATVGGHVEPGEQPIVAAKRELLEEMAMESDDGNWLELGTFRVSANRGGGTVSCFLALNAKAADRRRVSDEVEEQRVVRFGRAELLRRLLAGEFKEVKWAATAALSLLHLNGAQQQTL